jgi:cytochrome c-type biogenesis protein CcmH
VKRLVLVLLLAAGAAGAADDADSRYHALIQELRCLVCQNQSIADSNAPLAEDLRVQVRKQIDAGRSDEEIIAYVTERYGDFVRYRPAFVARTWLLWLAPFVLVLAGAAAVVVHTRRSRASAAAPADPEALRRLLSERDP